VTVPTGELITVVGVLGAALIANWVGLRKYKRTVSERLQAQALQSYITEEQLQADFRTEIRKEMQRLRENDERRSIAYRKLEDENSDLRRQVASLEIQVMRLQAGFAAHGMEQTS